MKKVLQQIFSIKNNAQYYKVITIFGLKIKVINLKKMVKERIIGEILYLKRQSENFKQRENFDNNIFINLYLKINYLEKKEIKFNVKEIFEKEIRPYNNCYLDSNNSYIEYLFPKLQGTFDKNKPREKFPNFFYICGIAGRNNHSITISEALKVGKSVYIFEDAFLRSIFSHVYKEKPKYQYSIGFTIDDLTHYVDATMPSRLEQMLNDKNLVITDKQKQRARNCMKKILETHLSKYNNQPIYTPQIGRCGVPKVLVVDQSYGDWSITKGCGSEEIFKLMLEKAINDNPNADIIVKTHPDSMVGTRKGYYSNLKPHNNVYTMTDPINPISLIKYCDKVYVCTTQLGLEALICGKEVHTFGIPFYSGWGLTIDYQTCERRKNKRTLEELFYIAYIMYSHYVNPETKSKCEIEDAMEYLLKVRQEYFEEMNLQC